LRRHQYCRRKRRIDSAGNDLALWLRHRLAENDPAAWPTLALGHVVYRQREAMTAAIGFDEVSIMEGLAPLQQNRHQNLQPQSH
jgi:hypothetical protein